MSKEELEQRIAELVQQYGEWSFDIPLPHNTWTRGNEQLPHTRLKRLIQTIADLSPKPLRDCRILDLGCLDGLYSVECALQGAEVVGIDARRANVAKALFAREALELDKLSFVQEDVRNLSAERYGNFDVIVCSGLLYHLEAEAVFRLVRRMHEMVKSLLVIDSHVSLSPSTTVAFDGSNYHGEMRTEHSTLESAEIKLSRTWSSFGNDVSFVLTRPSLVNLLQHLGFSSVYECFNPPHLNFGEPGIEHRDRCTLVASKGRKLNLITSPTANELEEDWPEGSLSY